METEMLWMKQLEVGQTVWCLKWYQQAVYKHGMYKYVEGKRKTLVTDGIKDAGELNLDQEIGRFGAEPEWSQ